MGPFFSTPAATTTCLLDIYVYTICKAEDLKARYEDFKAKKSCAFFCPRPKGACSSAAQVDKKKDRQNLMILTVLKIGGYPLSHLV